MRRSSPDVSLVLVRMRYFYRCLMMFAPASNWHSSAWALASGTWMLYEGYVYADLYLCVPLDVWAYVE
jgi:hypothetical protein